MNTTLLGDPFENELDEKMSRKHSYNYGYIKYKYPEVYKLPEQDVKNMVDIVYEAPDMEEVDSGLENYIKTHEPEWKLKSVWKNETGINALEPLTNAQRLQAAQMAKQIRPINKNTIGDYMAQNVSDMAYGVNRMLNGFSGGIMDRLGDKYGYDTRMSGYLTFKDQEGTGNIARHLGDMAQIGGMGLSGATFLKSVPMLGNGIVRMRGRRNLVNQLRRGTDFQDINFGQINPETLQRINQLRELENLPKLTGNAYIPANVVKKFYNKRLNEGYTPQSVAGMGKRLFHEGGNEVGNSRFEHIQEIKRPLDRKSEYGYVSQDPKTGQTVIKSIYKK